MQDDYEVQPPRSEQEFARYYELRWMVLRAPWGEPPGSERDDMDDVADHAVIFNGAGQALAAGRLHFNAPEEAQIRYMAVADAVRGQGLGRRIIMYLERIARTKGARTVVLNAREEAAGFYRTMGYQRVGPGPTMFGTVAHVRMRKPL